MNETQTLNKRDYPFLQDEELKTLKLEDAKELNNTRFLSKKNKVTSDFVDYSRDLKKHADRRTTDDTEEYQRYVEATKSEKLALDVFLYNRPDVRAKLNVLRPEAPVGYAEFASIRGDEEFARYLGEEEKTNQILGRAATVSTDAPGQGNTLQTTVAQSIAYRIDKFNEVVSKVTTINQPYGNYDATKYNKYGLAGYMTEGSSVPDTTPNLTDATDGITKVNFVGKQFGVSFLRSWLSGKRISASVINQEMKFAEMEIGRGEAFQIISGTGAGSNDSGVTVIGTAATVGANAVETFVNAKASVQKANAFNLVAFMNAEAWAVYEKIALTNLAYLENINLQNPTIHGVPVIVLSNAVMPTTTGTTKVVVGDFAHYIKFTNGGLENLNAIEVSNATTNNIFNSVTAWLMSRDGGALFNDSFAQFTLTV